MSFPPEFHSSSEPGDTNIFPRVRDQPTVEAYERQSFELSRPSILRRYLTKAGEKLRTLSYEWISMQ